MSSEVENWDLICIAGHGDYAFCYDLTVTLLAIALAKPIELYRRKERLLLTTERAVGYQEGQVWDFNP